MPRLRRGWSRGSSDEALLVRTGWKLAILTSLLLFGLVLAVGATVYLEAKSALLQPLRNDVSSAARQEAALGEGDGNVESGHGAVFVYRVDAGMNPSFASAGGPRGTSLPAPPAARGALAGRHAAFSNLTTRAGPFLIYTLPVVRNGRTIGVVQTAGSLSQYDDDLAALLRILVVVGAVALLAAGGITALVVRRALLPIGAAVRRQRDFVTDAAHELRTPLTIIRTAAEMGIEHGSAEEPSRSEITLKQTLHMTRLVSDMSLLARADSGMAQIDRATLDLERLVTEVVTDVVIVADERNVSVSSDLVPQVMIEGDSVRLRQVLLILLDNALKHSPDGGVIAVTLETQRRDAVLRIADGGEGIPPRHLAHVFERFYRTDAARAGEGTGLGLAIALSIVRAHGGRIWAENLADGGAQFGFALPLAHDGRRHRPRGSGFNRTGPSSEPGLAQRTRQRVVIRLARSGGAADHVDVGALGLQGLRLQKRYRLRVDESGLGVVHGGGDGHPDNSAVAHGDAGAQVAEQVRIAAALKGAVDA